VFGQTGPKVGSFDAGYGSTHMARLIGKGEDMCHTATHPLAADAQRILQCAGAPVRQYCCVQCVGYCVLTGRSEEGQGDVVPGPHVHRPAGTGHGADQHRESLLMIH
jgi:hypothetical protein